MLWLVTSGQRQRAQIANDGSRVREFKAVMCDVTREAEHHTVIACDDSVGTFPGISSARCSAGTADISNARCARRAERAPRVSPAKGKGCDVMFFLYEKKKT